jgi:hypothetical protein
MSRTVDGTVGLTKNQPPTVTRPFDFGTDAIERQRVSLGQSIIDADFEYGLQATKWQTYQEIRKTPSFYEIPGTDIQVTSVTTDAATPSIITVNINTSLTTLPSTLLFVGSIISIVGLANSQRNADRSEGFFVVRSVTNSPVTSFTFEARGVVSGTTVSTSYTVLRRGGVYTNGNAFLPYAAITTNGASPSVITVAYPQATPHGLLAGTPIQTTFPSGTIGTIVGGLDTNATGSFTIISTPTANSFTFTATGQVGNAANQTATKAQMASATSNIFVSPYSYAVHRPFDGGVLLSPGQPSFGASSLRQSKKVFRYQSGKGLLWSSGTLFCPNNDVVYANVVGSVINVVCDVPHGSPQAGATIQLKGISTPGYNGTYTVSSIIDSRTLSVIPAVVPTVSPAVLGDQPRFIMNGWAGASVRAGCFEDQNGLFWEWDGQTLWAVKRSSTFQLGGYVTATAGSQVINGDTSDTSVYLNSTINTGTAVSTVTGLTGTYPAGSSTSNINVTVSVKSGTLNPGLLMPLTAMSPAPSPGAASVIPSVSTYSVLTGGASAGATLTVTATPQGPIVPGSATTGTTVPNSAFPNLGAGGTPYVSAAASQTSFTVTFPTAPTPVITNTNIVGVGGVISATTGSTAHYLTTGSQVNIAGLTPSTFNGTYRVTSVPSSTTYTVAGTATGTYVQVSQTAVNPTTALITTAVNHGLSNGVSVTTTNTGFTFANGTFASTYLSPTVVSVPVTATVPGSGTAVYTVNGTFSNARITTTSSAFSVPGTNVTGVNGTYPLTALVTSVVLTVTNTPTGTFVVGQAIDSGSFGATSGTIGYITTVTSQTNITVTFPSTISPASTMSAQTFYAPVVVTTPNTFQAGTKFTVAGSTGGSGINVTGAIVSPVGLSTTSFQYSTVATTAVPTGGTITISPFFVQVTTTTSHGFIQGSTFPATGLTVTGGDSTYAPPGTGAIAFVISPTVVQYVTVAAPVNTLPTAFIVTYTATTPFFSAGVGDAANFIASGLNLSQGTYANFVVGGTNTGYTQRSATIVAVTSATTVNYVVAPSTSTGTSPVLSSTVTAPGTSQVNFTAGSFTSNVVTVPPSTNTPHSAVTSWSAITNQTTLAIAPTTTTLIAGQSVAVSAFGGYGGYAYIQATGISSGAATVIFSQPQTLASGSATIAFNTNPTTTPGDLCDLAYATLAPTTSNNATTTTGSFVANFVVPQTFASGSLTGTPTLSLPLATGSSGVGARIMPFVADPIPVGTSNLLVVATTGTVSASSGFLYNGMQTTSSAFRDVFGSNAYVTYSPAFSNAFIINFPPLATSITKAQVTGLAAQVYVYPNTRFVDQLRVNDKVVIRGMTHTVVQIQTQGTMIVNPPYRGVGNITVPVKMCKVKEVRTPQSQFNRDTIDGTGPSGFKFDPTKMQMIGLQYTWYGAGFVDFMMRGGDGNWVYAHRYKQNNINDEAYMRTGNMPVRYELINESVASSSALAAPTGLTDTTLTLTEAPTYWPPSGNVLVDNEFMTYTGKSGNTLTGIIRKASMAYNVNDQSYTLTASPAEQYHQAGSTALLVGTTCTPSLTHWGSAFIMDGQFDSDRGYFFNYSNVITGATLTAGQSSNVFLIRLAPSVSNGIVGDMGQRDLLSRAQLLLQKLEVIPTGGTVNVTGILNPSWTTPPALQWSNVNSTALGSQPSFTQVSVLGNVGTNYIGGSGERIFSTIAPPGAQNTIDLSALKELSNTIIGGNGIFPDGPDTLMIQLTSVNASVSAVITNLFWTEAQA